MSAPVASSRDRRILYAAAFLRALATGMIGVLLGLYLARLDFDPARIGFVISAGLAGGALAALLATTVGDRVGRKRFLLALTLLGAAGGAVTAAASSVWVMIAASFFGMLNGMGRDRGAALVLDQAILPATTSDPERTRVFAIYNLLQDIGHAVGGLLAVLPAVLRSQAGVPELTSMRVAVGVYAVLTAAAAAAYAFLGRGIEAPAAAVRLKVSRETRRMLFRISSLFSLDALGGGFLTTALLSFFFFKRFGVGEGTLGVLFFFARALNAVSHLGAAWLARRIGLVKTMVFTHLPSSFLLVTVPWAPNFTIAALLFLLREGLVEMDVPTRQSYVMAVVKPEERTVASGVTHLVRVGLWAVAPSMAGLFMKGGVLAIPLYAGAGLKIVYDLLLYRSFKGLKPPEERPQGQRP